MSELHWALLLIAAVVLLALYLYGKWQERQTRAPAAEDRAAVNAARIEPTLGSIGGARAAATAAATAGARNERPWDEDRLLDVTLELHCSHAFDGVAALEARAQLDRLELPLPTHLAVWDSKAASWSVPDRFGFYSAMLIAVQLASRRHALGEIDAARLIASVQQIAVAIDADFDPPETARLVQRAAELDRLCAHFDVQITLTLEAPDPAGWSDETIDTAARGTQLVRRLPGRSVWCHDTHGCALVLAAPAETPPLTRLVLTLDVPLAFDSPSPLPTLFSTARELALRLNARLVDDNGRIVEQGAEAPIEGELQKLAAEMRTAGIEPGSDRARRLYAETATV